MPLPCSPRWILGDPHQNTSHFWFHVTSAQKLIFPQHISSNWRTHRCIHLCYMLGTAHKGEEDPRSEGNDSSHLLWWDYLDNTVPPDLQISGKVQDLWKSITVCSNTRAAPTYFIKFYRYFIRCTRLWPPPPPRKLLLAASPAPWEAKGQGMNAKGKKSLCTQAMSSSKLHKAGTGREDVIPMLAGHPWWEQEWGSCSLGTPSPGHGWDRGG